MLGPVFNREAITLPRRPRHYALRAIYVTALLILMCTAWMLLAGTQVIDDIGDLARFGVTLFQIVAPLQLALIMFLAAFGTASSISQEKDRRTILLLLLTRLSNHELVLGKLIAALLSPLVMVMASIPVLLTIRLFGGISLDQVVRVLLITASAALATASLGCMIAFWREKTFQTLSIMTLGIVIWIGGWEAVYASGATDGFMGVLQGFATWASPVRGISSAIYPNILDAQPWTVSDPAVQFSVFAFVASIVLNTVTICRVRKWNPSRQVRQNQQDTEELDSIWQDVSLLESSDEQVAEAAAAARATHVDSIRRAQSQTQATRRVWDNPVLWREICTWAYGRKILIVRIAYVALCAMVAIGLNNTVASIQAGDSFGGLDAFIPPVATTITPLFLVSLVILNALAVNAITNERDGQALDLLLVTDLRPAELVLGKLWGVFWVAKETIVLPIVLCVFLWTSGAISLDDMLIMVGVLVVLDFFVAMLGIHCGMTYANSRTAISISMGSVFFLFLGVITCIMVMISFSGDFQQQLAPFLAFILGGSVGLYVALGIRNPSQAIFWSTMLLPFATFHAITSFFIQHTMTSFIVISLVYGFTTLAMLMPAIGEFDIAMGRTKNN